MIVFGEWTVRFPTPEIEKGAGFLKIKELVQRTQISKETIHYYIREGLLPKPRKRCKNMADYDESYIEKIRRIKELQHDHFLPLGVIKDITEAKNAD